MTWRDKAIKRGADILVSTVSLLVLWPVIVLGWLVATIDTGANGMFRQQRIGRGGRVFNVCKLRTMKAVEGTTVTTANDARITKAGAILRKLKLDELPQFWNVFWGDMSLVGPRPDVPGYMDKLSGDDQRLWDLRPGITGPATLKYRNEEQLLAEQSDPETYNDTVIWPDKVRINLEYMDNWSFRRDMSIFIKTFFP
jgi:lipopolysaccharide/colanic/teichoic acid biosynthesis glycosyltransferase